MMKLTDSNVCVWMASEEICAKLTSTNVHPNLVKMEPFATTTSIPILVPAKKVSLEPTARSMMKIVPNLRV